MDNTNWLNLFAYLPEYSENVLKKANDVKQEKGEALTYKDFNAFDLIHPGGHDGVEMFFRDYHLTP